VVAFLAHILEDGHDADSFAWLYYKITPLGPQREEAMYHEEKTFTFRFSLEAVFPDEYEGDDDQYGWVRDWEVRMKPELLKTIFQSLRRSPAYSVHVRNRGKSPVDEIEIAVRRDFSKPQPIGLP
jgi:hypothetical protein